MTTHAELVLPYVEGEIPSEMDIFTGQPCGKVGDRGTNLWVMLGEDDAYRYERASRECPGLNELTCGDGVQAVTAAIDALVAVRERLLLRDGDDLIPEVA